MKDYPEELVHETQKLLSEYQKLPDFKLSNLQVGSEAKLTNAPRDLLGLSVSHTDSQGKFILQYPRLKKSENQQTCKRLIFAVKPFIIEFLHSTI